MRALCGLQVDDTTQLGDASIFELEEKETLLHECKIAGFLGTEGLPFNGALISFVDGKSVSDGLLLTQSSKLRKLVAVDTPGAFISSRALGSYESTVSRPCLLPDYQLHASRESARSSQD